MALAVRKMGHRSRSDFVQFAERGAEVGSGESENVILLPPKRLEGMCRRPDNWPQYIDQQWLLSLNLFGK